MGILGKLEAFLHGQVCVYDFAVFSTCEYYYRGHGASRKDVAD